MNSLVISYLRHAEIYHDVYFLYVLQTVMFLSAEWGGAKLADVLELVGIPKLTGTTSSGGKHVEFVSIDMCKEEKGGPYKASIPLIQATNPEADVLIAYEMNGEGSWISIARDRTRCYWCSLG